MKSINALISLYFPVTRAALCQQHSAGLAVRITMFVFATCRCHRGVTHHYAACFLGAVHSLTTASHFPVLQAHPGLIHRAWTSCFLWWKVKGFVVLRPGNTPEHDRRIKALYLKFYNWNAEILYSYSSTTVAGIVLLGLELRPFSKHLC